MPMSSHWRWWVQPSAINTLSPSCKRSIAAAPFTAVSRKPLYRAIKIENEVRRISSGTMSFTLWNTWLSVITSDGFVPRLLSVASSSVSRTIKAVAPASSRSRIVCCCGRISLPFGAAVSIGITKTVRSPSLTKSEQITRVFSVFPRRAIVSFKRFIFVFSTALTEIPSA